MDIFPDNWFWYFLRQLEGKTIKSIRPIADYDNGVLFETTDGFKITLFITNDGDMAVD